MQHVTKEQAILLKELGYNVPCTTYWHKHIVHGFVEKDEEEQDFNKIYSWMYSRPSLLAVTDWLRDKGLHVMADPFEKRWDWNIMIIDTDDFSCSEDYTYPDHDTALSAGIDAALQILKARTT